MNEDRAPERSRWFELGTDGAAVILVAVDGTPTSLRAAAFAIGQARRQHARLLVVHVRDHIPAAASLIAAAGVGAGALTAAYESQDVVEQQLRQTVCAAAWECDVDITFVVRRGERFREITRLAEEAAADSIVVGASTRLGHRLAGSLAVRLVRCGRWPVTVVP